MPNSQPPYYRFRRISLPQKPELLRAPHGGPDPIQAEACPAHGRPGTNRPLTQNPRYRKHARNVLAPILCGLLMLACNRDISPRKLFHDTTAHYNIYFNGLIKYEEALLDIRRSHTDDYNSVLPIFVYGTPEAASGYAAQFEETVKKCSKAISQHEISRWVDDCFLLIGKAYFMKRDYFESIESFQYVHTKWKRAPIGQEALLWLVRAYSANKQYSKAQATIELINANKKFPKSLRGEFHAVCAELYINQKRYEQAIEPLEKALRYDWKRTQRARMHFVLGQLYGAEAKSKASRSFEACLKFRPPYQMQFQARLQLARMFDGQSMSNREMQALLRKMLKDVRNQDYFDEIYYELAMLSFSLRQPEEGMELLLTSVNCGGKNTVQKAKGYAAIADHYFDEREYLQAQLYYDSCAQLIKKDNPRYREIKSRSQFLGDLARCLSTVQVQDSLLELAELPEKQILARIDQKISDDKRREEEAKNAKKMAQQSKNMPYNPMMNPMGMGMGMGMGTNSPFGNRPGMGNPGTPGQAGAGGWYFYDQQNISRGYNEFRQLWGNRELTDYWRRSNREKSGEGEQEEAEKVDSTAMAAEDSLLRADPKAYYLSKVPQTQEAKDKSLESIRKALMKLGEIYNEKLGDYPLSLQYYEQLLAEHSGCRYEPEALYRAGLVHERNKQEDAKKTKHDRLIRQFPESDFAQLLLNPESFKPPGAEDEALMENWYRSAYRAFVNGDATTPVALTDSARSRYRQHPLIPNFEFLSAICLLKLRDSAATREALTALVGKYPNHPVSELASEWLKAGIEPPGIVKPKTRVKESLFSRKPEEPHFYVLAIALEVWSRHKEMQVKLSNFNQERFSAGRLKVNNMLYGEEYQLLVVREMPDEQRALHYYESTQQYAPLLKGLPADKYYAFVISKNTYNEVYGKKLLPDYLAFFSEHLKPTEKP